MNFALLLLGWCIPSAGALRLAAPSAALGSRRAGVAMSAAAQPAVVDVAVVGAGLPGRGMGWFHAQQVVSGACPSARLTDVVEPWFLGGGRDSDAGRTFAEAVVEPWSAQRDVAFAADVADAFRGSRALQGADEADDATLPKQQQKRLALVAGRTVDNPALFRGAIEAGATHVILEKPGAPSVEELESMAAFAEERGVPVFMGFIKNISPYLGQALAVAEKAEDADVTLSSHNSYTEETLAECFKRNAEGMLKNMAIHELALAVDFFGVTVDTLAEVRVNAGDVRTLDGLTDVVRVDATLVAKDGRKVTIVADRCGPRDGCAASVAVRGVEVAAFPMVDDVRAQRVAERQAAHPDWIGYLLTQEDEYRVLKETCCAAALKDEFPAGVATIRTAIEALKLAEHLTPIVTEALLLKQDHQDEIIDEQKASSAKVPTTTEGGLAANTSVLAR